MDVYLNGEFLAAQDARIAADDAGLQHGVGLFETMAARHGRVFRLQAHLDRLAASAQELGLVRHLDTDSLAAAVARTIRHNKLRDARVRLTVTAGSVSLLKTEDRDSAAGGSGPPLTVLVSPAPPTEYAPEYFERGITVVIAPARANPFDPLAGHKTLAYWSRLRTLRQAASVKAGEAIWLNVTNHLASGAVSNLFLVKNKSLLTPFARGEEVEGALSAPVRPGITRATVIELAKAMDVPVERKMLTVEDLLEADEVFLTNSSWQVLPVTRVEKKAIGDGEVGPITQSMRTGVLDLIERETQSS